MKKVINFGKLWDECVKWAKRQPGGGSHRMAKQFFNDWRKRHGRSKYRPHYGNRPVKRAQRVGSPAWAAWKNEESLKDYRARKGYDRA